MQTNLLDKKEVHEVVTLRYLNKVFDTFFFLKLGWNLRLFQTREREKYYKHVIEKERILISYLLFVYLFSLFCGLNHKLN